jgi:DNA-binding NarL/FixJ family response regulator
MRDVVAASEGFTLVGEALSGEGALEVVDELSPDLAIVDKRMPGMGGVEATRALKDRHPGLIVVIVSLEVPDATLAESSGAAAFVRKQELSPRVLQKIWRDQGP